MNQIKWAKATAAAA